MATLHLVCGLPCAGKTTVARRLEHESNAIRLCPDEWILQILPEDYSNAELDRLRDPVESLQCVVAKRLLAIGVDVILEWGFWERSERVNLCNTTRELGATVELHYLDVPLAELLCRVEARNRDLPDGSFYVSPEDLTRWHALFEAPDEAELSLYDRCWL